MATSVSPDGVLIVQPGWTPQVFSGNIEHGYPNGGLALVASTPPTGYNLVNASATILSWNVPNDGQQHRISFISNLHVTSAETGGAITLNTTLPDGTASNPTVYAASLGAGLTQLTRDNLLQPGTSVTLTQAALSAGASVLFAQLWAA